MSFKVQCCLHCNHYDPPASHILACFSVNFSSLIQKATSIRHSSLSWLHLYLIFNELPLVWVIIYYRESDITKERIEKILATGANVILTTGGIDDLCLKYFVEKGAMAVRRCKKQDLKRIAKATGGKETSHMSHVTLKQVLTSFALSHENAPAKPFLVWTNYRVVLVV